MEQSSENPLLSVKNLAVSFGRGDHSTNAVKGVSFHINKGETVALVGESGSGKSVTALSIMQLLPYPTAHHPQGEIWFEDQQVVGADEQSLLKLRGNRVAMIFQEPLTSLNPLHTIEKQINEALFLHKKITVKAAHERVVELLQLVGLDEAVTRLDAYPHEFSGGQQQRIMIAMALANDPNLLIADEPTTALDVTVQAQVLELLQDIQKKLGMAVLFITHDLNVVRRIADRVLVMHAGEVKETGPVASVFDHPVHDYTKHLLSSEPKGHPAPVPENSPEIIKAQDIKVWFPIKKGLLRRTVDHVKAVDGISLNLHEAQTLGVIGESGSGKSTLGRALLKLEKCQGVLEFQQKSLQNLSRTQMRPLRREMQIVFQDPYGSLSPRLSVRQIIEEGLLVHKLADTANERLQLISNALNEVDLDPSVIDRYPHEFSGGQRQRIAIARAIILKPKLIILDEPTSALDLSVQSQIVDLLRELQISHKLAYLFISHDLKVVRALSHNIIVMRHGKVVETGSVSDIVERPQQPYTQALMAAAFDIKADHSGVVSG